VSIARDSNVAFDSVGYFFVRQLYLPVSADEIFVLFPHPAINSEESFDLGYRKAANHSRGISLNRTEWLERSMMIKEQIFDAGSCY
jgi:hypothetical protein